MPALDLCITTSRSCLALGEVMIISGDSPLLGQPAGAMTEPGEGGCRVLIVDDDEPLRRTLPRILAQNDRSFDECGTIANAIERLESQTYDLVLLDYRLPDATGLALLDWLQGRQREEAVVMISGEDGIDAVIGALRRGADDFVRKPYHVAQLQRAVKSALHKSALERANRAMSQRLRASERLHRYLVESSPDLIFTLDPQTRFTYLNPRIETLLGYERHQPLNRPFATILLPDINQPEDAEVIARKVLDLMQMPFRLSHGDFRVSANIGISIFPRDGDTAEALTQHADVAMYQVKRSGRNGFRFFDTDLNAHYRQRIELENDLRTALERDEFELYFQPQVSVSQRRVVAMEALIRWHHPIHGLLSPGSFIQVAEEVGLITRISHWVIDRAARQLARWRAEGHRDLRLSCNLSPHDFDRDGIVETIREALATHHLPPAAMDVEITESVMMQDTAAVTAKVKQLREVGIGISIDDFGTGYSALAYLQKFPITSLKIDRSFVRDLPGRPRHPSHHLGHYRHRPGFRPAPGGGRRGNRRPGQDAAQPGLRLHAGLLLRPPGKRHRGFAPAARHAGPALCLSCHRRGKIRQQKSQPAGWLRLGRWADVTSG